MTIVEAQAVKNSFWFIFLYLYVAKCKQSGFHNRIEEIIIGIMKTIYLLEIQIEILVLPAVSRSKG